MGKIITDIWSKHPLYFIRDVETCKNKTKFELFNNYKPFESDLFNLTVDIFNKNMLQIILDLNILSRLDLNKYLVSKLQSKTVVINVDYQALEHSKFENNYTAYVNSYKYLTKVLLNLNIQHSACLNKDDFNNIIELYNEIELLDKNNFLFNVCTILNNGSDINTIANNILNLVQNDSLRHIHLCLIIIAWMAMLFKHGDARFQASSNMSNLNKSPKNFSKKSNGFHDVLLIYYLNIKVTYLKSVTGNIFYMLTHDKALADTIALLELSNSIKDVNDGYQIYNEMNNPAGIENTVFNNILNVMAKNI